MGPRRDRTLHPAPRRADQRRAPTPLQPCSPACTPSSLALLDDALHNPRLSGAPTAGRTVLLASELHDVAVPSSPQFAGQDFSRHEPPLAAYKLSRVLHRDASHHPQLVVVHTSHRPSSSSSSS